MWHSNPSTLHAPFAGHLRPCCRLLTVCAPAVHHSLRGVGVYRYGFGTHPIRGQAGVRVTRAMVSWAQEPSCVVVVQSESKYSTGNLSLIYPQRQHPSFPEPMTKSRINTAMSDCIYKRIPTRNRAAGPRFGQISPPTNLTDHFLIASRFRAPRTRYTISTSTYVI